ncbi:GntR family transcriptional regulator [Pseudorhodobacter turbinis]|uniref:GntR family transcriptional regulator n=2 Tax=Pseudorhodobacter turbinis TaxID=2500533 RepID=A0A4P8EDY9_9RHOB|nr:GntR family transcriptional regulator [Pseudorhodobacter turbinis]
MRPLALKEGATAQSLIYGALREALMSGYFRPGEEISLRKAAFVLGTSVTPVREALRQLQSDGALEVFGGNRVLRVPIPTDAELLDIRDIRINLEGFAAALAISEGNPPQMRLINNAFDLMQRAAETDDVDMYLENNWRFHSLIYGAAGRPVLLSLIEAMWVRIGPLIRLAVIRPYHFDSSMDSHRAALEALREGNAEALRNAIVRDIRDAANDLKRTVLGWHAENTLNPNEND